jgi:hypothetical protein
MGDRSKKKLRAILATPALDSGYARAD